MMALFICILKLLVLFFYVLFDNIGLKVTCLSILIYFRLETITIIFIVIAVVMGCFAIMLLTFGFLATGATRQNIYSGVKCIMGGSVSAAFVSLLYVFLYGEMFLQKIDYFLNMSFL